jgi:hypothetical protein
MRLRVKRILTLFLALGLVGVSASADDTVARPILLKYDLDSATAIYCSIVSGAVPVQGTGRIKTTGSSATVNEFTASSGPFAPVAAGDVLAVQAAPSTTDLRFITAKASSAQLTVNPAVDWSASATGYSWSYYHQTCGTASTSGWFDVSGLEDAGITVEVQQMDATAVLFRIECRKQYAGAQGQTVYPGDSSDCGPDATLSTGYCSFAGVGAQTVYVKESEGQCRVALKIDTDDGADTTTHAEQITIGLVGRIRK